MTRDALLKPQPGNPPTWLPTISLSLFFGLMLTACGPIEDFSSKTQNALAESGPQKQQRLRMQRIRFVPGDKEAVVRDSVLSGTRDIYLLGAGAGQLLTIEIASLENNAVFNLAAPGEKAGELELLKTGASTWSGRLPAKGDYQLTVNPTRGNASYRLQVSLK